MLSIRDCVPEMKHGFNPMELAYWHNPAMFSPILSNPPSLEGVANQIEIRSQSAIPRHEIVQILLRQYNELLTPKVSENIKALASESTFTVCCAHQPLLLGGAAFLFYKIIHVVSLCRFLKNHFPHLHFVPVYYCGCEDHNIAEISTTQIFNHAIKWDVYSRGAVGRLDPSSLTHVFDQLKQVFSNDLDYVDIIDTWKNSCKIYKTYTDFYRHFIHSIFKDYGVIFLNPDDVDIKNIFSKHLLKELTEPFVADQCGPSIEFIKSKGYEVQANPREINLFLHYEGDRLRIGRDGDGYMLHPNGKKFSRQELLNFIDNDVQALSPNVLTRPLLQEYILPNIIFVGGGSELSYWLQLKSVFEYCRIPYPILVRRFSGLILERHLVQKMNRMGISLDTLHATDSTVEKEFIARNDDYAKLMSQLDREFEQWRQNIISSLVKIDKHSFQSIEADFTKINKQWDSIKAKIYKILKDRNSHDLNKLRKLKATIFPNKEPQERTISFLPIYLKYRNTALDEILNAIKVFDAQYLIIECK